MSEDNKRERFQAVVGARPIAQSPTIQKLERAELEDLLKSSSGRSVLWRILATCGIYSRSLSETDSLTAFQEGRRSIGLELLLLIRDNDPEAYIKMQSENLAKQLAAQEAQRQKEKIK